MLKAFRFWLLGRRKAAELAKDTAGDPGRGRRPRAQRRARRKAQRLARRVRRIHDPL